MHKKSILLMLLIIISTLFLHAEPTLETTLDWKVGKDTVIFTETVTKTPSGYVAVLNTSVGEYDRQVMDTESSVLEWQRKDASEGTDILALRQGEKVTVKGTYKGKPYEKTHNFGNLAWYQLQEASYEELYKSGLTNVHFWLRKTDGRFLKLEAPAVFGVPKSAIELIGERLF